VLLFQLAVPSEIPGYVLGLAGCRFRTFVIAMALGELPFAIGAVYLGESFLDRNYALLLAIGITGIAFSWVMFRRAATTGSSDGKTSDVRPVGSVVNDDDRRDRGGDQPEVFPENLPGRRDRSEERLEVDHSSPQPECRHQDECRLSSSP
jgi:hypothetical protein